MTKIRVLTLALLGCVCSVSRGQENVNQNKQVEGTELAAKYSAVRWLTEAGVRYRLANAAPNPLGVEVKDISPEIAGLLGISPKGAIVSEVPAESAAYAGGIRSFDLILQVGDQKIESADSFNQCAAENAGKSMQLVVMRHGERKELKLDVPEIRLQALGFQVNESNITNLSKVAEMAEAGTSYRLGVVLGPLEDALRAQLDLDPEVGVLITEVTPESAASNAGVEKFDVLVELDGKKAISEEFVRAVVQEGAGKGISLKLIRKGKHIELKAQPVLVRSLVPKLGDAVSVQGVPVLESIRVLGRLYSPSSTNEIAERDDAVSLKGVQLLPKTNEAKLIVDELTQLKNAVQSLNDKVQALESSLSKPSQKH